MQYAAGSQDLINTLEAMAGCGRRFGAMQALLRYGRSMDVHAELPNWVPVGIAKQCYANAVKALAAATGCQRDDIHYAEGYAISKTGLPFPIQHAWLVDGEGRVIDPTWMDHRDHVYYGVAFETSFVLRMLDEADFEPGLLVNPSLIRRQLGTPDLFAAAMALETVR